MQKLRKKAHLVPTDEISVFYTATGDLNRVAKEYTQFIENTLKTPFKELSQKRSSDEIIIEEKQKLKDFEIHTVLTRNNDVKLPLVNWANIQLIDIKPKYCKEATKGLILLQAGNSLISLENLKIEITRLFSVNDFDLLLKNGNILTSKNLKDLNGQVIFVVPVGKKPNLPDGTFAPFCKFVNFEENGFNGTIILENPVGNLVSYNHGDIVKRWKK